MTRTSYFGYWDRIHYKYYCYMSVEEYLSKIKGWDLTEREPLITIKGGEHLGEVLAFLEAINPKNKPRRKGYREYDGKKRCTKCNERKNIEEFNSKKQCRCNECIKKRTEELKIEKAKEKEETRKLNADRLRRERETGEIIDCDKCDATGKVTIGSTDVNGVRTEYVRKCGHCHGKGYYSLSARHWTKEGREWRKLQNEKVTRD
jgi:hypothetical protein